MESTVRHYEMLLKRAQLESMKFELGELSLQKIYQSGFSALGCTDQRWTRYLQARCREMLKVVVADFKRGDADEVLHCIVKFNIVLKAWGGGGAVGMLAEMAAGGTAVTMAAEVGVEEVATATTAHVWVVVRPYPLLPPIPIVVGRIILYFEALG